MPQIAEVGFALSNPYNLLILLKSVTASNAVIVTVHITGIVETINTEKHPVVILERQKLNTIQLLKRIIMPKQNYCLVAKLPKKKQQKMAHPNQVPYTHTGPWFTPPGAGTSASERTVAGIFSWNKAVA